MSDSEEGIWQERPLPLVPGKKYTLVLNDG
jgi:hypothetical protein